MKLKRVFAALLALCLVFSSFSVALAADDLTIRHKVSGTEHSPYDWPFDYDFAFDELYPNMDQYVVASDGQWYEVTEINAKVDEGMSFKEAVSDSEPVNISEPGDLEVVNVSAINSTAIKIEFNKAVDKTSATSLYNYYVGIGDNDVESSSIAANNGSNYEARLLDEKTVVISAKADPKYVIWVDKNTTDVIAEAEALKVNATDVVVKNKTVTIQVRNVRDAEGNLMSTQEKSFKAVDNTPATIYGATVDTDGNIIRNDDNVTKKLVTSKDDVYFVFDEPIYDNDQVQYYLGSKNITANVEAVPYDEEDLNSVKLLKISNGSDDLLKDLKLGKHKFRAVGLQDLAGNKPAGDIYEAYIEVVEPEDVQEPEDVAEVKDIEQVSEGEFRITFKATPADDTVITVKDSDGNTVVSKNYSDISTDGIFEFAKDIADYKNSTQLRYRVEVTGADGGKIETKDSTKKANKYSEMHVFKLDLEAPTVAEAAFEKEYVETEGVTKITVPFTDKPFYGKIALNSDMSKVNDIILKQTIGEETKSAKLAANTVTIVQDAENPKLWSIELDFKDATNLLNDDNVLPAGEYELILPRGLVEDTGEKRVPNNERIIPFAGKTLNFEIKAKAEGGTGVSVPQTAQNLVKYDEDHNAIVVRFVGEDIDASTAKDAANYKLAGKPLKVDSVEYEILEEVKVFKADGTDGDPVKVNNKEVPGAEVRLFLSKDTVELDGNYTLEVSGVTTSKGAAMKAVKLNLNGMKDNTRPVLEKATITGTAKLELVFSETVKIENEDLAAGNFKVLVNGAEYTVDKVEHRKDEDGEDIIDTLVILSLKDSSMDFEGKTVIVITRVDDNGDYFVRDLAGNELKAGVEVIAEVE